MGRLLAAAIVVAGLWPAGAAAQGGTVQEIVTLWQNEETRDVARMVVGAFAEGVVYGADMAAEGDDFYEGFTECYAGWSVDAYGEYLLNEWDRLAGAGSASWRGSVLVNLAARAYNDCPGVPPGP